MKKYFPILLLLIVLIGACKKDSSTSDQDLTSPKVVTINPGDGATDVNVSTEIFVEYDEIIRLDNTYQITINGETATASVSSKKLSIEANLTKNTTYSIDISATSVKDIAGNYAEELSFSFTTNNASQTRYEAEEAVLSENLNISSTISGYSGTGYVTEFTSVNDSLTFNLKNITKGNYDLYIGYATSGGDKACNVAVNGSVGELMLSNSPNFNKIKYGKIKLLDYNNKIKITPNWTYFSIDYIEIVPNTDPEIPFNLAANLVTPSPSTQAVNLYNFLKNNFQTKIISGTMAAHSTNINEATWVHDQTGKWPALTGFDFIDHTWLDQNWVEYSTPITLGTDWWANNGLVAISWHWRDPLTKSGSFYTNETTFDVSKVSDPNSDEYKAMIVDLDTIAGYLREFKNANIPVLWRPLHEAAGGWFWWGAKGAAPCKALWQLMFDRLVNYHGLNNLIWVWTTNTSSDALDWYPGDNYVDIIGMDIYPGENQHGSQYIEFDKAKEIFGGKKILTLSECGSVPDPALMMEYGDTWSWFMPWNGDFTRSDAHNGTNWWNKFFSYDFVITRDKMPNLK